MRIATLFSLAFWLGLAVTMTGCGVLTGTGAELYSAVGMRRIDEHRASQSASVKNSRPLKCLFVSCNEEPAREVQGS